MGADIVFGLFDDSEAIGDATSAQKHRDFTLWWSRYDYHGPIIERASLRAILDEALACGHRYCFIQSYGHLIRERWTPEGQQRGFLHALADWVEGREFLVAGCIQGGGDAWWGLEPRCLLVDLERYAAIDSAFLAWDGAGRLQLPEPNPVREGDRALELQPSGRTEHEQPGLFGWELVAGSLAQRVPVLGLDQSVLARALFLEPESGVRTRALARYFGPGIDEFRGGEDDLSEDQRAFLEIVDLQTKNAQRGVFLFNIECYADVENPPEEFVGPVTSLYSVAAGFKPYRVLKTHGFDLSTRIVFFDYSPNALAIKERMLAEWDGEDFPSYARYLFQEFPHPETFYQLWLDASPDDLDWSVMTSAWERELERWGGPQAFKAHWEACRTLEHEFVQCDIMGAPWKLIQRVKTEPNAVIWWSNAFFTMRGNWFHAVEERRALYERFSERLAATSPGTFLYGSDYNNISVNGLTAGEYWVRYRSGARSALEPCKLSRTEIRM